MNWEKPSDFPHLKVNDIHVWLFHLEESIEHIRIKEKWLSKEELERVYRFRFERDRERFIISHGTVRELLGKYLNKEPSSLYFHYNVYGKPFLKIGSNPDLPKIYFNLSHSGEWGILAVAREKQLGVDIEKIRESFATIEIAERFFAPGEVQALKNLFAQDRVNAFFNCWTCKEAFIKAIGMGLSFPLRDFEVSINLEETVKLQYLRGRKETLQSWSLFSFDPIPGYKAAIAIYWSRKDKPNLSFFKK